MSAYQPGTVAVATIEGDKGVRVIRYQDGWAAGTGWYADSEVTDVRPLVVLDLDGMDHDDLLQFLRTGGFAYPTAKYDRQPDWLARLADQIEAQTKPPRIPEPGWGAVVEAHTLINETRRRWVNAGGGSTQWHDDGSGTAIWDFLIDPILVREGLS